MSLCAHRHPDGSYCKRHAPADSRFCYRHEQRWKSPGAPDSHEDVHPLARLATREDVFNVVREALNAVRLGRISPGQAYAVGYLADRWLRIYDEMLCNDRARAVEKQCLPELMEAERQAEALHRAPLPLPVQVDPQGPFPPPAEATRLAVEHAAATLELNLKPPSDYPGYVPPPDDDQPEQPVGAQHFHPESARGGRRAAPGPSSSEPATYNLKPNPSLPDDALVEKVIEHVLAPLRSDTARRVANGKGKRHARSP